MPARSTMRTISARSDWWDDGTGRVVRAGQADELRFRSDQGGEAVQVDLVAGVEGELEVGDVGADRAGCLEVAGVVGAGDDEAIAGAEQGGRGQEEGAGRADRDQDVVRGQGAAAVGGDLRSQRFAAAVVAVAEQEVAEGGWIEADVVQGAVAHRAFGEVDADAVVADLLGALDLHDHALVVHSSPLRAGEDADACRYRSRAGRHAGWRWSRRRRA